MTNEQIKKIIKIAIIALVAILVIIILVSYIQRKSLENATYKSIEEIPNNMAAVMFMKCKYINEEESKNKNYSKDIYLEFGKPLYDVEESNEIYYSQLIQIVAIVNNYQNFRLIDEKNEIIIAVACNSVTQEVDQIVINGDPYYYSKTESLKELKQFTETPVTELNIQSKELVNLINEGWQTDKLNLQYPEEYGNGYVYYPMDGIEIKTIKGKAFNLLFEEEYIGNIVNDLNMESSFQNVISKLGEPTFGSIDDGYIGYKGKDVYIFFSDEEVSVYRVENKDKAEFTSEIEKYLNENNIKTFVSNITDIWTDYDKYDYSESTVDLSYILNGVKIQYGISERHGITYYKNYTGTIINGKTYEELSKVNTEIPKYIYFRNVDSIDEYEAARVEERYVILYGGDIDDWE